VAIVGLALLISIVGLIDDVRGLGTWLRLLVVTSAAVVIWAVGISVNLFAAAGVPGGAAIDAAITVIWIVGITNAFNLLDNMDGLSAGVAAVGAFFFFLIAALNGQFLVAALAIALAGCALGFLRHNFHPATIYMGDAGSLFLGFVLAVIGIKLTVPTSPAIAAFVPILVLGVAIFDTTLVTLTRLRHRRSPFAGGRDHVSHRLVHVGITVPIAVGLIYGAAVGACWLAVVLARLTDLVTAYLLLGFTVAVGLVLGALLAMVPVYETSSRQRVMLRKVAELEDDPSVVVRDPELAEP
jgi:UDP-GlcNAc:undecaprenyl-phosphate/decaprenyl-phosphate GlcNAc-1-phosphate transferase